MKNTYRLIISTLAFITFAPFTYTMDNDERKEEQSYSSPLKEICGYQVPVRILQKMMSRGISENMVADALKDMAQLLYNKEKIHKHYIDKKQGIKVVVHTKKRAIISVNRNLDNLAESAIADNHIQPAPIQTSASSSGLNAMDKLKEKQSSGSVSRIYHPRESIGGYKPSFHCLKRMQERDCTVEDIQSTLKLGTVTPSKRGDGSLYYDDKKSATRVIINPKTKTIKTVYPIGLPIIDYSVGESAISAPIKDKGAKKEERLSRNQIRDVKKENLKIHMAEQERATKLAVSFREEDEEEALYQSYFDEDYLDQF